MATAVSLALPRELSDEARRDLALEFAEELSASDPSGGQLPYTLAIHAGGGTNPHCHLLINERLVDEHERSAETWFRRAAPKGALPDSGGARKSRALHGRAWLTSIRERWATMSNSALEAAGAAARVDHRSLASRGIDAPAPVHLGPRLAAVHRRGKKNIRTSYIQRRVHGGLGAPADGVADAHDRPPELVSALAVDAAAGE